MAFFWVRGLHDIRTVYPISVGIACLYCERFLAIRGQKGAHQRLCLFCILGLFGVSRFESGDFGHNDILGIFLTEERRLLVRERRDTLVNFELFYVEVASVAVYAQIMIPSFLDNSRQT